MPINSVFDDEYLEYLESIPAEDREETLIVHLKHEGIDMESFELYIALMNKNADRLKGYED